MANKKAKGKRANTRNIRSRGRVSPNKHMAEFSEDAKVQVVVNGCCHSGMPFRRHSGKTGTVNHKQGKSYVVRISEGKSVKSIIVNPVHLSAINPEAGKEEKVVAREAA
jgi:ribosomal protein L21E